MIVIIALRYFFVCIYIYTGLFIKDANMQLNRSGLATSDNGDLKDMLANAGVTSTLG